MIKNTNNSNIKIYMYIYILLISYKLITKKNKLL